MMEINKDVLERYHRGQCSKEELRIVKEWLHSEEYDIALHLPDSEDKDEHKASMWLNIMANLDKQSSRKTTVINKSFFRYVASVVILISVGLGYYFNKKSVFKKQFEMIYFEDFNTYHALKGKRNTVKLPDGSIVTLNSNSKLKAPLSFDDSYRVIYLQGHAHFEISKNPNKPFIIYTDESKTEVLGTSFDINTFKKEGTEIIVKTGVVSFSDKKRLNNSITLKVNDRAVLNTNKLVTTKVDAEKLTAWKDNRLIFDNLTLSEIIRILEPWFNKEFEIKNKGLLKKDFKLSIQDASVDEVMQALSFLGDFSYKTSENKIVIY